MDFLSFMANTVGDNWVIARRSKYLVEKYGDDVQCVSPKRYAALRAKWIATLPKCGACGQLTPEARALSSQGFNCGAVNAYEVWADEYAERLGEVKA